MIVLVVLCMESMVRVVKRNGNMVLKMMSESTYGSVSVKAEFNVRLLVLMVYGIFLMNVFIKESVVKIVELMVKFLLVVVVVLLSVLSLLVRSRISFGTFGDILAMLSVLSVIGLYVLVVRVILRVDNMLIVVMVILYIFLLLEFLMLKYVMMVETMMMVGGNTEIISMSRFWMMIVVVLLVELVCVMDLIGLYV